MKPQRRLKHGFCANPQKRKEYMVWVRMRRRCNNPLSPDYPNYGGRGIKVCLRWESYENFLSDMGRRPGDGYMLDRVNNDGHYEPGNCRWATVQESNDNKRTTRRLTVEGVTKTLSEWSRISGTHQETIRGRIRRGWSVKDAIFSAKKQEMLRVGNRWRGRKHT